MQTKPYKRILLKLSGELLMGNQPFGIDVDACEKVASALIKLQQSGLEIGVVIGGGNIFRGIQLSHKGVMRTSADQMGMLATLMNGLALQQALEAQNSKVTVMSALACPDVVDSFNCKKALEALSQGTLVIFVGGTGNPYFTTDSAAALRAAEINADILLKATKVDGIYDKDPIKHKEAVKYDHMSYAQVLAEKLEVMDATAISLCQRQAIPIFVFNMQNLFLPDPQHQILSPQSSGTLVSGN